MRPDVEGPQLAGSAYWRKNPLLASMMVPLLLTLAEGRFTGLGPDGAAVFDAPAPSVTGELGRMGTFKLAVGGRKFALVGRGSLGGTEKSFSGAQIAHLQEFLRRYPRAVAAQPTNAGAIDAVLNASAAATLGIWRDALRAAGAGVR